MRGTRRVDAGGYEKDGGIKAGDGGGDDAKDKES